MRRAPCAVRQASGVRRQARTRTTGNAHKKRFIAENRGDLENDCVT
ncbi:conserved hypothetical protein [Burkholderia mallei PRL-20]|nr:conserved hypothetical protein [Burkholderia mallei SAVP1]EES45596.1 conserved hypothetical protein [Burkholderia mallei PRL-20]